MSDRETLDVYAARAGDYARGFSPAGPDQDLRAFIDALPRGARVLDLGCGPGTWAKMMMQAGLQVEATDASPEMVTLAQELGVEAGVAGFDDLDAVAAYDAVWANFSLLHAPRAAMPGHLSAIARALTPSGLLHLGLKTGEGEARDHLGRFYTYYTEPEIRGLLAAAGFGPATLRHDEGPGMAGTVDPFMMLRARLA